MKNSFDVTETLELVTPACSSLAREKALHVLKDLAAHMMPHKRRFWEALAMNDVSGSSGKKTQVPGAGRQQEEEARHQVISMLLHSISCPLINDVACLLSLDHIRPTHLLFLQYDYLLGCQSYILLHVSVVGIPFLCGIRLPGGITVNLKK